MKKNSIEKPCSSYALEKESQKVLEERRSKFERQPVTTHQNYGLLSRGDYDVFVKDLRKRSYQQELYNHICHLVSKSLSQRLKQDFFKVRINSV
jgi:hypothetical protein